MLVTAKRSCVRSTVTRLPSGGVATARAAIKTAHLRLKLLGDTPQRVDPASANRAVCFDFTRDRRIDIAVSIASGGTAGDIGFVVFRGSATGWKVALSGSGYKLGLVRVGGDFEDDLETELVLLDAVEWLPVADP